MTVKILFCTNNEKLIFLVAPAAGWLVGWLVVCVDTELNFKYCH